MASNYMIGATVEALTSLDELTVPVPNPQPEPALYMKMVRLGNAALKGFGPQTIIWDFPIIEVNEVEQLEAFKSTSPIYIQSTDRFDTFRIYEVIMNWPDPRQDGRHMPGFRGYRGGLQIEFIIRSEVEAS